MLHCCETRMKHLQKHAPTLIENAVIMIVHDEWPCTIPNAGLGNVVHELKSLKVFSCRKYILMLTLSCEQLQESRQTARFSVSVEKMVYYICIYLICIYIYIYMSFNNYSIPYWSTAHEVVLNLGPNSVLTNAVRLHLFGSMPLLPCQGLCEQGN